MYILLVHYQDFMVEFETARRCQTLFLAFSERAPLCPTLPLGMMCESCVRADEFHLERNRCSPPLVGPRVSGFPFLIANSNRDVLLEVLALRAHAADAFRRRVSKGYSVCVA